jgi:hypothetical protein
LTGTGVCAATACAQMSSRLEMMVSAIFTY